MENLFNFKKKVRTKEYSYNGHAVEVEEEILNIPKIIVMSGIGLFILITIFDCFAFVKSGEVGLRVRFGKIVDTSLNEGINFKIPYIEKVVKVNIKVQKIELTTESSSKDLQTITTQMAVNYRVANSEAPALYKNVGNNYEETILTPAIQESIKAVYSQYTAEQLITLRNEVSDKCLDEIQGKIEKYGIVVEDMNIIDLDFSYAYNSAIEEKQVAEQKVLTAKQELEKEKIEAEKKVVEAQATKEANDLLKQTITDEVLIKQFIEKWDGHLSDTLVTSEEIYKIFGINK